jgi:hypothetical protein
MLENETDSRWTSKELNDKLNSLLSDSFALCRSTIEETKDVVEDLQEMMGEFDILKARKQVVRKWFHLSHVC